MLRLFVVVCCLFLLLFVCWVFGGGFVYFFVFCFFSLVFLLVILGGFLLVFGLLFFFFGGGVCCCFVHAYFVSLVVCSSSFSCFLFCFVLNNIYIKIWVRLFNISISTDTFRFRSDVNNTVLRRCETMYNSEKQINFIIVIVHYYRSRINTFEPRPLCSFIVLVYLWLD